MMIQTQDGQVHNIAEIEAFVRSILDARNASTFCGDCGQESQHDGTIGHELDCPAMPEA